MTQTLSQPINGAAKSAPAPASASAANGQTNGLTNGNTNGYHTGKYNLTVDDILSRRKRDGRLVAGTAAIADIDSFKTYPDWHKLPKSKPWDHLLSTESASREACVLKQAAKYLKKPGMISLGGGLPTPSIFPISSLSIRVPTGLAGYTDAAAATEDGGVTVTMGKYDTSLPASSTGGPNPAEYDLSIALNYGQAAGSAQMLRWVTEHTELVCRPPYSDWSVALSVGSTGALEQALRIFCDRERGDMLLTENFSFSSALETAAPLGIRVVGIEMDAEGLLPQALDDVLAGWDAAARGAPKPHVLYTVPSGQNPTGATQGLARRQAIYNVCKRHDVYILEDEPYYFLQMPDYQRHREPAAEAAVQEFSPKQLLDSLVPTYVSLDVDGRVMRMDSFSKVLVPGSRMGWVTASAQIIQRFVRHAEACNQGPAGIAQVAIYELLEMTWGHEGYLKWLAHIREAYTERRNILLDACEDLLPTNIVSWTPPTAGMFHWLKVDHTQHADYTTKSIRELETDIFDRCIEKGVLVGRGSWFAAEPDKPLPGLYFRATFAAASAEAMTEAIRRFGEAVRESYNL